MQCVLGAFSCYRALTSMQITTPTASLSAASDLSKQGSPRFTTLIFFFGFMLLSVVGLRQLWAQETSGVRVSLQVIVVDTESKAREALERLKRGGPFADVAKEMSIDPNASSGGYVGEADVSSLRPEVR